MIESEDKYEKMRQKIASKRIDIQKVYNEIGTDSGISLDDLVSFMDKYLSKKVKGGANLMMMKLARGKSIDGDKLSYFDFVNEMLPRRNSSE